MSIEEMWDIIGWSLAALTLLALLLAVLADPIRRRFRKARRCPKCWYDLSHTPGLTCSECGYTARREKQLFRTRRRKRWIVAMVLLWLGSYFAFRAPAIAQRGWIAGIPTTALALLWTQERIDLTQTREFATFGGDQFYLRHLADAPFTEEIFARLSDDELSDFDWRVLIEVALRTADQRDIHTDVLGVSTLHNAVLSHARYRDHLDDPALLRRALLAGSFQVSTRRHWPLGADIYAVAWTDLMLSSTAAEATTVSAAPLTPGLLPISGEQMRETTRQVDRGSRLKYFPRRVLGCVPWTDHAIPIGRPAQPTSSLEYTVSARRQLNNIEEADMGAEYVSAEFVAEVSTRVSGSVADMMTPIIVPEFDAALRTRLQPRIHYGHIELPLGSLEDAFVLLDGATFAAHIELIHLGQVIAAGDAWWCLEDDPSAKPPAKSVAPRSTYVDLQPLIPRIINPAERGYTLRLTASPAVALRRFESNRYWSGQVEWTVQPQGELTNEPPQHEAVGLP
ncbi:MAG: hypothetical protein IT430_20090 [Phycisphaerales bacterium]|nr:hypothetical protein [Phycisphaerales bacterium]